MSVESPELEKCEVTVADDLCKHYTRRCLMQCQDCSKFYPCRLCHNEKENHELNRYAVTTIKCSMCNTVQKASDICTECKSSFGKYSCLICKMYDDREREQFHCDACGLCRVGGRENFFHCPKCDMCLGITIRDSHRCVEKSSKSNCAICMEDMHTSTQTLQVPSCGHLIHHTCYQSLLEHGEYRCPTCGKSTVKMTQHWENLDKEIASTPMPQEYANTLMWILCKDCHVVSQAKFHVLGMKCHGCGSYNTCGSAPPEEVGTELLSK